MLLRFPFAFRTLRLGFILRLHFPDALALFLISAVFLRLALLTLILGFSLFRFLFRFLLERTFYVLFALRLLFFRRLFIVRFPFFPALGILIFPTAFRTFLAVVFLALRFALRSNLFLFCLGILGFRTAEYNHFQ